MKKRRTKFIDLSAPGGIFIFQRGSEVGPHCHSRIPTYVIPKTQTSNLKVWVLGQNPNLQIQVWVFGTYQSKKDEAEASVRA